ncbi:P-loop containing nucleoside triphosphate hydrolase protein [Paraphysoderma sedebokerense]|nr:P-loop containing nucleoside triphosphate hydrolase protein [Paraphysoderma sedebokerense]
MFCTPFSREVIMYLPYNLHYFSAQTQPDQNDLTRMKELSKAIATLTSTLNKLQSSADPIQTAIKELQARILEIGGVKLRSQKAKVDGIIEEMDGVNERITKVQVARGKAEKDLKKAGERLEKGKRELEAVQSELEQVESDIKVKTEAALEVKKKCEEAKMIMADKKEELDSIKAQLDEKSQIVDKIRAVEVEIKARLDELKIAVTEGKKRSGALKAKLKELSLQKIGVDEEEDAETLEELSIDELKKYDKRVLIKQIQDLEAKLSKAKPNLTVLAEYKQRHEEYIERAKELAIVNTQREEAKNLYDDLRKKRLDEFMSGFTAISLKLKEMYQMITLGGNAELELVDSMDPFSEGILFSVMPPKKSWKNISNLSGGEKTLSSLALVFALHHFKPTPLYVMDEIDAALDFRNVSIVANYIKNRTKNAQFVIISLRNNMFELADRLVGIYKTDNCTKSICVNPKMMVVGGAHHVKVEENEKENGGRATEGIVGSS